MAIKYGNDIVYAREKLYGSYISYKDTIVEVVDIDSGGGCELVDLMGHGYNDHLDNLNLEPIKFGYVNSEHLALYYVRMPQRHYRQGFRKNTVVSISGKSKTWMPPNFGKELLLSYRNIFPPVERCIEYVFNGEKESSAFSKDFAVNKFKEDKPPQVEYKGVNVGQVDFKKDELILSNKFLFLKESLEKWL